MSEDQKVPEFELSEATKQHIENMVTLAMTQVVATVSATMQNKIIEAASKQEGNDDQN